jgi:hypothetical protein
MGIQLWTKDELKILKSAEELLFVRFLPNAIEKKCGKRLF